MMDKRGPLRKIHYQKQTQETLPTTGGTMFATKTNATAQMPPKNPNHVKKEREQKVFTCGREGFLHAPPRVQTTHRPQSSVSTGPRPGEQGPGSRHQRFIRRPGSERLGAGLRRLPEPLSSFPLLSPPAHPRAVPSASLPPVPGSPAPPRPGICPPRDPGSGSGTP